jgi:hypothetical protein
VGLTHPTTIRDDSGHEQKAWKLTNPTRPRKFTLIDAIVLIAATAVALVPIRYVYIYGFAFQDVFPFEWTLDTIFSLAPACYWVVTPLLVTWSLAVWALRWRQPRPRLHRLFRQPGLAATTAILVTAVLFIIKLLGEFGLRRLVDPVAFQQPPLKFATGLVYEEHIESMSGAVLTVWVVMWLAGAWRSEASWVDRAGRALGVCGLIHSLFFSWFAFVG